MKALPCETLLQKDAMHGLIFPDLDDLVSMSCIQGGLQTKDLQGSRLNKGYANKG